MSRYGETWVYESIVGAVPGLSLSPRTAVAVQFVAFETAVLVVGLGYGLEGALLPGTAAVVVAAGGSAFMLDIGDRIRATDAPAAYRRLLFGTSIEVLLGLLAYAGLVTYLFVYDPRSGSPLLADLLGERPPLLAAYLLQVVLWDVCYRIGTGWWAAVAALWRSARYSFDPATAAALRGVDARNAAFALLQLALVPLVWSHRLLAVAVAGHVAATLVVVGASYVLLRS
jgi:hypothetical protein